MIIASSTESVGELAALAPMGHPWPGPAAVLPLVTCTASSLTDFDIACYPFVILNIPKPAQEGCLVKNDL